jgi:valyl-tRNA synthetase
MASTQAQPSSMPTSEKPKSEKPVSEKQRRKLEKFAIKKEKQTQQKQKQEQSSGPSKDQKSKKQDVPAVESKDWIEETPAGQRKILKPLDDDFHKAYIPRVVESAWYSFWEDQGLFKPQSEKDGSLKPKGKYVIAIPPPNVWTHACIDDMVIC